MDPGLGCQNDHKPSVEWLDLAGSGNNYLFHIYLCARSANDHSISAHVVRVSYFCVHSCCCYVGKHKDFTACPYREEPRLNSSNELHQVFHYSPLISQLRASLQSSKAAQKMGYRTPIEREHDHHIIQDVFDGVHYRSLCKTKVTPDSSYRSFDNTMLALSLLTTTSRPAIASDAITRS